MPPRKKATGLLTSVNENHLPKPSAYHMSMHSKGIESSGDVGHSENKSIMDTIEGLQHSLAAI